MTKFRTVNVYGGAEDHAPAEGEQASRTAAYLRKLSQGRAKDYSPLCLRTLIQPNLA